MWIGNCLVACLLLISSLSASDSMLVEDTENELILIRHEVCYCKFLTWMMYIDQMPAEVGLPWVINVLDDVEIGLNQLIEENE